MVGRCKGSGQAASEGCGSIAVGRREYNGAVVGYIVDETAERTSTLETMTFVGLGKRPAIASPAAAPPNMERKEKQPADELPATAPPDMMDRKNWAAAAPPA